METQNTEVWQMNEKERLLREVEEELKDMTDEEKQEVLACLLEREKSAA